MGSSWATKGMRCAHVDDHLARPIVTCSELLAGEDQATEKRPAICRSAGNESVGRRTKRRDLWRIEGLSLWSVPDGM